MGDVLRSIIPQFYGVTMLNNVEFIRMEHLTQNCPDSGTSIMDIKLGSKTYLRSEENTKQRRDLYQKVSQDLLQEKLLQMIYYPVENSDISTDCF